MKNHELSFRECTRGTVFFYVAGFGARIILDKKGCMKKKIL
jgi:hypothetical protein